MGGKDEQRTFTEGAAVSHVKPKVIREDFLI